MASDNDKGMTGLSERAENLLKVLIERYIAEGKPVGSRTLARDAGLELSPATIRNVMADLEEMGLVASPHTSAGRTPTVKGYRLFVDSLLTISPLNDHLIRELRQELDFEESTKALVARASDFMSDITRMAGLVMLPRHKEDALKLVEFMPLSENRVLAILVFNDRDVENRIIHTQRQYTAAELQEAANYLTEAFSSQSTHGVRDRIILEMEQAHEHMSRMMQAVIEMSEQVLATDRASTDYILAGQINLMNFQELSSVERLRELFEAFNRKRDILHLLDQCVQANGVRIFIGNETGYKPLDHCSMVTSTYEMDGEVAGVLGVIGPTRMSYERVIPIVDVTAKLLSAALNQRH
jgi:heat-inducible transcriptional repressor